MQKQLLKKLPSALSYSALAGAVLFASQGAVAAGLTLNEQSASAMGTAYAGRSSSALDASTVFGNPAGMSRLDRMQVSGGLAFIDPHTKIKDGKAQDAGTGLDPQTDAAIEQGINATGTNKGNMVPFTTIPFGYFVTPLDDDKNWHFGMGIYAPLGGKSKYEDTFAGRYQGRKTEVTMVTFQPTISYKFNDMVSVGVGPTISYIDGTLSSNSLAPTPTGELTDVHYTAKGDDFGVGANVGVLFQPYENTTFGLTYRSETRFKLSGDAKLEGHPGEGNPALDPLNPKYKGSAKLRFTAPESIDLSLTHKLDDQWTVYAGAVWTRWSRLDTIQIDDNLNVPVTDGDAPGGFRTTDVDPREEVKFKDTWAYSIGASYQVNPEWVVRAGFALDTSAASDSTRSVRTPIAERKAVTLGAGWNVTQDLTLDFAYGYLWESDAKVNQGNKTSNTNTGSPRPGYEGTFKNKAHGVSGQITYRF